METGGAMMLFARGLGKRIEASGCQQMAKRPTGTRLEKFTAAKKRNGRCGN